MLLSFQTIALVVIALIGAGVALYYHRLAEAEAAKLTPEDRQSFHTRYRNQSDRDGMPARLQPLAKATDRVRGARTGVTLILAIAVLFYFL